MIACSAPENRADRPNYSNSQIKYMSPEFPKYMSPEFPYAVARLELVELDRVAVEE